jgi:hypothetical protein
MDSNDKAIPLMAGKAQRKAVVHVAARPRIQSRSQGPDGLGPTFLRQGIAGLGFPVRRALCKGGRVRAIEGPGSGVSAEGDRLAGNIPFQAALRTALAYSQRRLSRVFQQPVGDFTLLGVWIGDLLAFEFGERILRKLEEPIVGPVRKYASVDGKDKD